MTVGIPTANIMVGQEYRLETNLTPKSVKEQENG